MTQSQTDQTPPQVLPEFSAALDGLIALAKRGHASDSELFNPSDEWLVSQMREVDGLTGPERDAAPRRVAEHRRRGRRRECRGQGGGARGP